MILTAKETQFLRVLAAIAALGGNLPDDRLTDKTGANDAAQRGLMYCEARRLAREAIDTAPHPRRTLAATLTKTIQREVIFDVPDGVIVRDGLIQAPNQPIMNATTWLSPEVAMKHGLIGIALDPWRKEDAL